MSPTLFLIFFIYWGINTFSDDQNMTENQCLCLRNSGTSVLIESRYLDRVTGKNKTDYVDCVDSHWNKI